MLRLLLNVLPLIYNYNFTFYQSIYKEYLNFDDFKVDLTSLQIMIFLILMIFGKSLIGQTFILVFLFFNLHILKM